MIDRLHDYHLDSAAHDQWSWRATAHQWECATIFRWREAFQSDFVAPMAACAAGDLQKCDHNPVAVLNGDTTKRMRELTAKPGETVTLSAAGSRDPHGHELTTSWFVYREAGSFTGEIKLNTTDQAASGGAPVVKQPEAIHVILQLPDTGTPALRAYRRAVIEVRP